MADDPSGADQAVQVKGAMIRGLIDHIARFDGVDGVGEVLEHVDLSGPQIEPDSWYSQEILETLVSLQADRQETSPEKVAYDAGRRMAASALGGLGDDLDHRPIEELVARLDHLVRVRGAPAIGLEIEDGHVVLAQNPPGGRYVCPMFHGIVEGLIEHLQVAGRIGPEEAHKLSCVSEGDDMCVYRIDRRPDPPG